MPEIETRTGAPGTLGEYLEAARVRVRRTRADVGERVGYHESTVYEIERRGQEVPRLRLVALLELYDVPRYDWPTVFALPIGAVSER